MSERVVYDNRSDTYRILIDGKPLEGEIGRALGFETAAEAEDLLERREALASVRVRPLREYR